MQGAHLRSLVRGSGLLLRPALAAALPAHPPGCHPSTCLVSTFPFCQLSLAPPLAVYLLALHIPLRPCVFCCTMPPPATPSQPLTLSCPPSCPSTLCPAGSHSSQPACSLSSSTDLCSPSPLHLASTTPSQTWCSLFECLTAVNKTHSTCGRCGMQQSGAAQPERHHPCCFCPCFCLIA